MTRARYAALLAELRAEWRGLVARVEFDKAGRRGPRRADRLPPVAVRQKRRAPRG